jgi:hypothetical protein
MAWAGRFVGGVIPAAIGNPSKATEPVMTKAPPVPPENQSHKGTGDPKSGNPHQVHGGPGRTINPDQQGQQANTKQNTTHQGYQQDR